VACIKDISILHRFWDTIMHFCSVRGCLWPREVLYFRQ